MLGDAVYEKAVCCELRDNVLVPGRMAGDGTKASELAIKANNKATTIVICCERPILDVILNTLDARSRSSDNDPTKESVMFVFVVYLHVFDVVVQVCTVRTYGHGAQHR